MPLQILSEAAARAANFHLLDGYAFRKAVQLAAVGLPAYFSQHDYHHQTYQRAALDATIEGLQFACTGLALEARKRGIPAHQFIGDFLAKLHPANSQAVAALIQAQSVWCGAFEEKAA